MPFVIALALALILTPSCVGRAARHRSLARDVLDGIAVLGAERVKVVARADNEPAKSFSASLGFEQRRRIAVHDSVPSDVWVIVCRSSSLLASASS
jgi:stage III sporulation protein SpoIIIAA